MKKILYCFGLLISFAINADCPEGYINKLNQAIDLSDSANIYKLASLITLKQSQKDSLLDTAQQWVKHYEVKAKSFWKNGTDVIKLLGGASLAVGGMVGWSYGSFLWLKKEDIKDSWMSTKTAGWISGVLGAVGIWAMIRGWQMSYINGKLYNARCVLEAIKAIEVEK